MVLREGGPDDVLTYIDGALLIDLWNDLVLPYPTQVVVEDKRLNAMVVLDLTGHSRLGGIEVIGVSPLLDALPPGRQHGR